MPKPTGLVGSIRDICDPATHHFPSVPRLRARLEDFEEIWQFDCLRRGAALVVPGPKVLETLDKSAQNRTKRRNLAQAIPAPGAHSDRLTTHNRRERPRSNGRFRPTIKEPNDEDEILTGSIAAVAGGVSYSSSANERTSLFAASIRKRGPRGRSSSLERCLHDRPRPKPMRRAHVGLW
jgi:hypothetical protein